MQFLCSAAIFSHFAVSSFSLPIYLILFPHLTFLTEKKAEVVMDEKGIKEIITGERDEAENKKKK